MKTYFQTEKYAYPQYHWRQDEKGYYFPDFIIDAALSAVKAVVKPTFEMHAELDRSGGVLSPLNRHRILVAKPELTWEQSCELVAGAFEVFDPRLGKRAREVMTDSARWRTERAEPGEARGRCIMEEQGAPVIEYSHDGTISDPVYVAHELGHFFAADFSLETGKIFRKHMAEVQAFFMQHVLYDYLTKHENEDIRTAATKHYIGEITRNLYNMPAALGALEAEHHAGKKGGAVPYSDIMTSWLGKNWEYFESAAKLGKNIDQGGARDRGGIGHLHGHAMASVLAGGLFERAAQTAGAERQKITDTLLGRNGPNNIVDALSSAGVVSEGELEKFCADAALQVIAPLNAIKDAMQSCPTAPSHRAGRQPGRPAPGS